MQVYEYTGLESESLAVDWSGGLWCEEAQDAGIETVYACFDGDRVVGFQSVNIDNQTIAIEVSPEYQGQGIASSLLESSGSFKPERNENKEFWAHVAEKYDV